MVKSRRNASCSGVPNVIVGIRELCAYSSDLKFTKSIHSPRIFIRAVSRCFDWSGLDMMTATLCFSCPWLSRYAFTRSANSFPIILSSAISISNDSLPMSLSLTQPPAHRSVVARPAWLLESSSSANSASSSCVSVMVL